MKSIAERIRAVIGVAWEIPADAWELKDRGLVTIRIPLGAGFLWV